MSGTHANRSIPEVFSDLVGQLTTLLRKEAELARTEVSEKISKIALGIAPAASIAASPGAHCVAGAVMRLAVRHHQPDDAGADQCGGKRVLGNLMSQFASHIAEEIASARFGIVEDFVDNPPRGHGAKLLEGFRETRPRLLGFAFKLLC